MASQWNDSDQGAPQCVTAWDGQSPAGTRVTPVDCYSLAARLQAQLPPGIMIRNSACPVQTAMVLHEPRSNDTPSQAEAGGTRGQSSICDFGVWTGPGGRARGCGCGRGNEYFQLESMPPAQCQ